jgi:hypothetical protein
MTDNNPTPDDVRKSIIPKSDQLNADDLIAGPITVTIEGVTRGDKDQPINVHIAGHQPYKPCKSMRRVLVSVLSDDAKTWIGHQMTLFCDPEVKWAGVKVGGIRISHLSGLDQPKTFLLTQTRGKRAEFTIQPIKTDDGYAAVMKEGLDYIAKVTEAAGANGMLKMLKNAKHVGTSKADLWKAFKDRIAVVGVEYDAESKTCKPKEA